MEMFICKRFYIEVLIKELGMVYQTILALIIYRNGVLKNIDTYDMHDFNNQFIINEHNFVNSTCKMTSILKLVGTIKFYRLYTRSPGFTKIPQNLDLI